MTTGTSWCWACDLEHLAWAPVCVRCGAALHDAPPPVEGPVDHDTIEIDLSGMEPGARDLFLLFLDGAGIHHSVSGLLLSIAATDEQRTRELLESITSDTLVEFDPAEPVDDSQWSRDMAAMMHPSAMLPPERVAGGVADVDSEFASLPRRAIASFVGSFVWSAVVWVLVFASTGGSDSDEVTGWLRYAVGLLPTAGDVVLVALWGSTPGMFVFDMRVVDRDGHRPGWRASIVRILVLVWPSLLFVAIPGVDAALGAAAVVAFVWPIAIAVSIATGPQHQGWHDRLAGTWVVHGRSGRREQVERPLPGPTGAA
ncbi:MAG: RDD family protein [Microthrixaceae bacterium]